MFLVFGFHFREFGRKIYRNGFKLRRCYKDQSIPTWGKHRPVYMKNRDVILPDDKNLNYEEVYVALAKCVDEKGILGIQKIRGLWNFYIEDRPDRIKLITQGINMRGKHVPVYDVNPYLREKSETTLPVYVYGVPLGVPDELVKQTFEKLKCNVKMVAKQRLRVNNRLTNTLNGVRVVNIEMPKATLPRDIMVGSFKANLSYRGQTQAGKTNDTCTKCLKKGHVRKDCTNQVTCNQCNTPGHIRRNCPTMNDQQGIGIANDQRGMVNKIQIVIRIQLRNISNTHVNMLYQFNLRLLGLMILMAKISLRTTWE